VNVRELKISASLLVAFAYAGFASVIGRGWLDWPLLVWPVAVILLVLFLAVVLTDFGETAAVMGGIALGVLGATAAESPFPLQELALGTAAVAVLSGPVRALWARLRRRGS